LPGRRLSASHLIIPGELARRDAFYQCDPVYRVLERLHLRELAEQPALEGFLSAL